jgi:hypothetical protein
VQFQEAEAMRALRVLRSIYVVMRYPFRDEIEGADEAMGRELAAAIEARDWQRAQQICEEAIEWARKLRHPIARRLELALGAR